MTELQLSGAQMMIDILSAVAPMVLVFVIGKQLVKLAVKFFTGRGW